MKNLIKKIGKGVAITGLSAFLFYGCSDKVELAQPSDYLGIEFITNSQQVSVQENFIGINYPNGKAPYFRVEYIDSDADLNVDLYAITADYKEGAPVGIEVVSGKAVTGKSLIEVYSKEYAQKHELKNVTCMSDELQSIVNKDYKELRKYKEQKK